MVCQFFGPSCRWLLTAALFFVFVISRPSIGLFVYSFIVSFEHLDTDADRVRSFLRDCVCDESSSD